MNHVPPFGISLRTRLTLWYGALLALTLLGFSVLLYFTLQQSLSTSMNERLSLRANQVQRVLGPNLGSWLEPEDVSPRQVDGSPLDEFVAPGIYVQVVNTNGAVIAAPPNLRGGDLPVTAATVRAISTDQPTTVEVPVFGDAANVRLLTVPVHGQHGEVVGAVQVAESLSPFEATMSAVERLLLTAGCAALLLAVALGWLFTRRALSPVAHITATARHIAATGDYRRRLGMAAPARGRGDELFFLAATFDDMIERLEHVLESQRRLLADTSHELRNPLTVIRGNLALLRRPDLGREAQRESVVEAEEEAARMGRLVDDLLLLARADAGELPALRSERVDLQALAQDVVDQARAAAGARRLSVATGASVWVEGDRDRLKQLLANLVENALRYTPETGSVMVSVTPEVGPAPLQRSATAGRSPSGIARMALAHLTVTDTGIGISPNDLPHVFERFYRVDRARSRAQRGSGLGLSIAQYIARAHAGWIEAASAGPNRGSTFHVRLPMVPADSGQVVARPAVAPRRPAAFSAAPASDHPSP
ncbi:MAG: HAMP domain-containing histidine kinase [Chloroflexi bacterium]|nr:HAMP domain-containing histidine kinase [Chloroflexota bacterium]